MHKLLAATLENLYQYDSIRLLKDKIRPIKHFIFGKNGIYKWVDQIASNNQAEKVKIVFDIGASVGDTALTFLNTFKNSTVYAFEPLPVSRKRLQERTSAFKNKIQIYSNGFFNAPGVMPLNLTSYHDASSLLPMTGLENKRIKEVSTIEIKLDTIDNFVKQKNIEKIDLCKIDVEGVEMEVLEGGRETFKNKISNLIIEISGLRKGKGSDSHVKVFQFLHECGFTFIGCDVDYFFSKDKNVLERYFDEC